MRGPSLCCCCCCAVLSSWGVRLCASAGVRAPVCLAEFLTKKHQYLGSIQQWESPNAKYSSVAKITAKLWQFQWFIYSRVQAVREMKEVCACGNVCWMHFSICGAGLESKLHENINTFDKKKRKAEASIPFSSRRFKGIFLSGPPLCVWGDARRRCDERRQSQRKSRNSPFQEKVTCAKLHTKWFTGFGISSLLGVLIYTGVWCRPPSRAGAKEAWDLAIQWKCRLFLWNV